MLGREVALPVELMLGPPVSAANEPVTSSEYVAQFAERCEKAFRVAREHVSLAQQRQKRNYDARIFRQAKPFSVNDKVWLAVHAKVKGRSPKLQLKWTGPFLITHKLSDCLYRVKNLDSERLKVVHIDHLKLYLAPDELVERPEVQGTPHSEPIQHNVLYDERETEEFEINREFDMDNELTETDGTREAETPKTYRRRRPPVWMKDYVQY